MGCLSLPYQEEIELPNFLAVWKKSAGKENCENYYPFGLSFNSYNRENSLRNQYLYNRGAERQDELDLNVDFTKFRMYDPAMGRWWQVDPLASNDALVSFTPYNYSFNNPILYNDPEGDDPILGAIASWAANKIEENFSGTYAGDFVSGAANTVAGYLNPGDAVIGNITQQYEAGGGGVSGVLNVLVQNGTPGGIANQLIDQGKGAVDLVQRAAAGDGKAAGELTVHTAVAVAGAFEGGGPKAKSGPTEAYNRSNHYGKTPTQADRNALGAKKGQDVDHNRSLVKHYYEGDGKGSKPGYSMTKEQRKTFANDRSNMSVKPQGENRADGGKLSQYSKDMKKKYDLK